MDVDSRVVFVSWPNIKAQIKVQTQKLSSGNQEKFDLWCLFTVPYNKDEMVTVSIDNIKTSIPSFLIKKEFSNINNQSIYIALKFIGKFIERNILLPNNINYPKSRINLENCFL